MTGIDKNIVEKLEDYYARQIEWSRETFGPDLRTKGVIQHIRKELAEIEAEPHDLSEWVDVIILAMDGFWRHGGKPTDLMPALLAKQAKNMARTWPDWRTMGEDQAIEHDRSGEGQPAAPEAVVKPLVCSECNGRSFADIAYGGGWRCIECKKEYLIPPSVAKVQVDAHNAAVRGAVALIDSYLGYARIGPVAVVQAQEELALWLRNAILEMIREPGK